jgi:hypothetical protein
MGKDWDKLDWTDGGGMAKAGIGERNIPWPSYSGSGAAGTANATCATCGGRMRGARICTCQDPDWRVRGEPLDLDANAKRMQAQQRWHRSWLAEVYRVLEPGGIAKVFGGSRVFHRLAAAMVDVGFTNVRLEAWGYGSGFPKSHNVSKAIDKEAGAERKVIGKGINYDAKVKHGGTWTGAVYAQDDYTGAGGPLITAPATPEAELWDGWGTALKPSWEPVLVGRKL